MNKLVLLSIVMCGACAKTESDNILTRGMYASFSARASNGTTVVSATLYQGQPTQLIFIELTGDDELIASQGTQAKVMSERQLLNVVTHDAAFQTDDEDDEFKIAFYRDVDPGAPDSTVTLPARVTIAPPPQTASRAANLTLTWSPSGTSDQMSWKIDGNCIEVASGAINGDPGNVTINGSTLRKRTPAQGQTVPDSCTANLEVTRTRDGDVDPAFREGGTFTGTQVDTASFMTTL